MDEHLLRQAETYLRLHLHALVPLHTSLVEAMCKSAAPPLELATTLEDIGQRYIRMADNLNGEIIRRGRIDAEPEDPEDFAEARIARFAVDLLAKAGTIKFHDGSRLDGRAALEASPIVEDAIKSAVIQAHGKRFPTRSRGA